jgi:hypothetical protein
VNPSFRKQEVRNAEAESFLHGQASGGIGAADISWDIPEVVGEKVERTRLLGEESGLGAKRRIFSVPGMIENTTRRDTANYVILKAGSSLNPLMWAFV